MFPGQGGQGALGGELQDVVRRDWQGERRVEVERFISSELQADSLTYSWMSGADYRGRTRFQGQDRDDPAGIRVRGGTSGQDGCGRSVKVSRQYALVHRAGGWTTMSNGFLTIFGLSDC